MSVSGFRIADQIDLSIASVKELCVIHEKMRILANIAYAMAWQGCCQNNAAGDLMRGLGDAFTDVETKATDELKHRKPADQEDR